MFLSWCFFLKRGFSLLCSCSFLMQINIWEERKVFGSRGQLLKEEFVGKKLDTNNKLGNSSGYKLVGTHLINKKSLLHTVFVCKINIKHSLKFFWAEKFCWKCIGQNSFWLSNCLWQSTGWRCCIEQM